MLRAIALLIVVGVGGAQDVSLLCQTWCSSQASPTTSCHHQGDSATPTINERACNTSLEASFVREAKARPPTGSNDLLTPLLPLVSSVLSESKSTETNWSRLSVLAFSRFTVLRI